LDDAGIVGLEEGLEDQAREELRLCVNLVTVGMRVKGQGLGGDRQRLPGDAEGGFARNAHASLYEPVEPRELGVSTEHLKPLFPEVPMRPYVRCCAVALCLAVPSARADLLVTGEVLDARIIGGPDVLPYSPDFDRHVFRYEPSPAPIKLSDSSGGQAEARAFASGFPFTAELSAFAAASTTSGYFAITGMGYEVDFVTDVSMVVNLTWAFDRLG